jgi:hypothetical protein
MPAVPGEVHSHFSTVRGDGVEPIRYSDRADGPRVRQQSTKSIDEPTD